MYYKYIIYNYTYNRMYIQYGCAMQKHDSLPQPPFMKMRCVPLTYTWQCDISLIDPTGPGVTSAHTGSAPC